MVLIGLYGGVSDCDTRGKRKVVSELVYKFKLLQMLMDWQFLECTPRGSRSSELLCKLS
jgi:hypothetical protein